MKKVKVFLLVLIIISLLGIATFFILEQFKEKEYKKPVDNFTYLYQYELIPKKLVPVQTVYHKQKLYILLQKYNEKTVTEYSIIIINPLKNKVEYQTDIKIDKEGIPTLYVLEKEVKVIVNSTKKVYVFDHSLNKIENFDINLSNESSIILNDNKYLYNQNHDIKKTTKDFKDHTVVKSIDKNCGQFNISTASSNSNNISYSYYDFDMLLGCSYLKSGDEESIYYTESSFITAFDNGFIEDSNSNNAIKKIYFDDDTLVNKTLKFEDSSESNNYFISNSGDLVATYVFDNKNINIYDFNSNKIIYTINLDKIFNNDVVLYDIVFSEKEGMVYLLVANDDKSTIYAWEYGKEEKLNKKVSSTDDMVKIKLENIKLVESIKKKYKVNVKIKESSVTYFPDFYALPSLDDNLINESLKDIESILSKFGIEFFKNFYVNGIKEYNIYLTSKLGPSNTEYQIDNPAGYSLEYMNKQMIAIDINEPSKKTILCHEIMHSIENNVFNLLSTNKIKKDPLDSNEWSKLNPKGYEYKNSYVGEDITNYTPIEKNKKDVYFVDEYSHTYEIEDRARIFENICANETKDNIILEYSNLKKKAFFLRDNLVQIYPNLKKTTLFKYLK